MARLVVLTEGLKGCSCDLTAEKTTVGRVDDNAFQIPEGSVSSHHCEVFLRGNEVVVNDLNSTNGTYINGQQITGEGVLKPGQTLRLGQVELQLENGRVPAAAPAATATAGAAPPTGAKPATPAKKPFDQTKVIAHGVKLDETDQTTKTIIFEKNSPFGKKSNKGTRIFIGFVIAVGAIVIALLLFAVLSGS